MSNFEGWGLTLVGYKKCVASYRFNFYVVHAFFISNTFKSNDRLKLAKTKQMLSNTLMLNFCYQYSLSTLSSKNNRTNSKISIKNKCVCIHEIIRLMIVRMMMKMKNRSHRHDINSSSSRQKVIMRSVSSTRVNIWSLVHVKVK